MTTPALSIPIKVVGLDGFKKNMTEMNVTAANVARTVTAQTIKMSAGFLASQGAAGAATLAFGKLLGVLRPITLGLTAVVDTFELLKESVKLAGAQIEAFNTLAGNANSAGVSTDFWQRFTKSAPNAVVSIDQVTQALQDFNKAATDKLGGSDIQQRIDELVKAGNFAGNSGVGAFANATDTESKLRAIVSLIDQAEQKSERWAAIDIAKTAFGEPVANALRQDSGYLDQVLQKADAMSKTKLVSDDDIARAIDLKTRLEAAQQVLSDKWAPVQRDLAELGINAHESWISVIEVFSDLVGLADRLYEVLKEIPGIATQIGESSIWTRLTELTGKLGLNSDPASLGIETGAVDMQRLAATNKLRAGLMNPGSVQRAEQQTLDASFARTGRRPDTSKAPGKTASDSNDAVDNAINSLRKHTEQAEADAKAVGLGAGALAKFRAEAAETAAVEANGGRETSAQAEAFKKLQAQAGAAADALAKAKINSDISFGKQTAFLSDEDVAVAEKLRSVYGDDVPRALASSQAAALKLNTAFRGLSSSIESDLTTGLADILDGTKSVSAGFADMSKAVIRAIEEMVIKMAIVQPIMKGISGAFGFGGAGIPGFADGTPSAPGGLALVGERGPELVRLPKGAAVYTNEQTMRFARDVPAFANGGVMDSPGATVGPLVGHTSVVSAPINISVQGSPGMSKQDHERLGQTLAGQIEPAIRSIVGSELRNQMRPGGTLFRR